MSPGHGHLTFSCCPPQPGWVGAVAPIDCMPGPMALDTSTHGASSFHPAMIAQLSWWWPRTVASIQIQVGDSCVSSPFGCCLTVQLVWGCLSCWDTTGDTTIPGCTALVSTIVGRSWAADPGRPWAPFITDLQFVQPPSLGRLGTTTVC